MATRVVGGGERFHSRIVIALNALSAFKFLVPGGANAARIQLQAFTTSGLAYVIERDATATLAANEGLVQNNDMLMDAFRPGTVVNGSLVDSTTGESVTAGADDRLVVAFYTNAFGRKDGP